MYYTGVSHIGATFDEDRELGEVESQALPGKSYPEFKEAQRIEKHHRVSNKKPGMAMVGQHQIRLEEEKKLKMSFSSRVLNCYWKLATILRNSSD